jgi:hypothetical protein
MDSTANGSWEKCNMAGEHMQITNLVFNKFIKVANFL